MAEDLEEDEAQKADPHLEEVKVLVEEEEGQIDALRIDPTDRTEILVEAIENQEALAENVEIVNPLSTKSFVNFIFS